MTKGNEGEPLLIPANPYGGHLAGRRWFAERYEIELMSLRGESVMQLETIVRRIGERPGVPSSDQQAHDQAARDALVSRAREMGLGPHKRP